MVGFWRRAQKQQAEMLLLGSFINYILLISKRLVEGFVPEIGLVVCLWLIVVL